jgi:hypothetical protein
MTVANTPRGGEEFAANKSMKSGNSPGTSKGMRESYLGGAVSPNGLPRQVSAGTPGPGTGTAKNTAGVMASAASPKGRPAPVTHKK